MKNSVYEVVCAKGARVGQGGIEIESLSLEGKASRLMGVLLEVFEGMVAVVLALSSPRNRRLRGMKEAESQRLVAESCVPLQDSTPRSQLSNYARRGMKSRLTFSISSRSIISDSTERSYGVFVKFGDNRVLKSISES